MHLARSDPAGREGKALLEGFIGLYEQVQRAGAVLGLWAVAYRETFEHLLKATTPGCRLAHRTGASRQSMNGELRLGDQLAAMPLAAEAVLAGEITVAHVRLLGPLATGERTRELFARDEAMLVGFAKAFDWPEFATAVKAWKFAADPDGAEDNAAADHANRRVHLSDGIDGTGLLSGILTPDGHAEVGDELDRLDQELFEEEWAALKERLGRNPTIGDMERTPANRRHDALVEMARRSRACGAGDKRPAPLLSVVVGKDTLADVAARIEQTNTIVTPGTVARIINDHDGEVLFERVVFDAPGHVVEVSEQRLFTGLLRRAVQVRDKACTWPGCSVPAVRCEIDHLVADIDGGPTSQGNAQAHCKRHNRLKERIRALMARRARHRDQALRKHQRPKPT
jgi:hypothetical protein